MPPACSVIYFVFRAATFHAECLLGLDFNQLGPRWSCLQGPPRGNAPLGMINESADSRNAAQLLWGAGVPIPGLVKEALPLPCDRQQPGIPWSQAPCRPKRKAASRTLKLRGTWKGPESSLLSWNRLIPQYPLPDPGGPTLGSSCGYNHSGGESRMMPRFTAQKEPEKLEGQGKHRF